jgi:choice-of-anchor B domain-containing protein
MYLNRLRLPLLLGAVCFVAVMAGTAQAYFSGFTLKQTFEDDLPPFAFELGIEADADYCPIPDDEELPAQVLTHHLARLADIEPTHQLDAMGETPCQDGFAGIYPCQNVDLMAFLPLSSIGGGQGNDIWGWTDPLTGREYAIMGRTNGTAFVDITEPTSPVYLGNLPTQSGNSTWRDIKVYADHAFVVSEALNHGMQVFDLKQLRNVTTPPVTFAANTHYNQFGRAHNVAINEETGFAYAVGSVQGTATCSGGLHMVNIQNPLNPTFAGCYSLDGYIHDTQCVVYTGPDSQHQGKEICFNANGSNTTNAFTIVDVSNKSTPVRLSERGYPGRGYAHQGWLTEDQRHFLLDDELDEQQFGHNTRTYVWDVSDLDAPLLLGHYEGTTTAIDHNQYIVGNFSFQANYRSGLRILRLFDLAAASLEEVAYFDVYPSSNSPNFNGAWSVYPYFESGIVVVSGIEQGLFVLRPKLVPILALSKSEPAGTVAVGETVTYTVSLSNNGGAEATGVVVTDTLNGNPVVLDGPDSVPAGNTAHYFFTYLIQPEDCATGLTNWAEAGSSEGVTAVLPAPVFTAVSCPSPELAILMSQPEGEQRPGEPITYTITVSNGGDAPATGVVVTATVNGESTAVPGPDTLAANASATYDFAYILQPDACDTTLVASAATASNEEQWVQISEPVLTPIACPAPALAISMGQPEGTARPGNLVTYTVAVANLDSWQATSVALIVTINGQAFPVDGPMTIAGHSQADYMLAYLVQEADCENDLQATAAASAPGGSGATLPEPVATAVICTYELYLPAVQVANLPVAGATAQSNQNRR